MRLIYLIVGFALGYAVGKGAIECHGGDGAGCSLRPGAAHEIALQAGTAWGEPYRPAPGGTPVPIRER